MLNTHPLQRGLSTLWKTSPLLMGTAYLTLASLVLCFVGLFTDHRLILGEPIWLKPAKFSISISIFCFSIAWVFQFIPSSKQLKTVTAWVLSLGMLSELLIISIQAWRGTISHFNEQTPMDAWLFHIMGIGIIAITFAMIVIWLRLLKQDLIDSAWTKTLRLALGISILGSLVAGFMLPPTPNQLAQSKDLHAMPINGAHTVGAPDGGPGLPMTNWNREHGDLRIAHFLGLHALQILPLIYGLLIHNQKKTEAQKIQFMNVMGISYVSLIGILLWQALRGQALLMPDVLTIQVLGLWWFISAGALIYLYRPSVPVLFRKIVRSIRDA